MRSLYYGYMFLLTGLAGCSGCAHNPESDPLNSYEEPIQQAGNDIDEGGQTIVKMRKSSGGVYEVPIEVNGSLMYFIFDTGAGIISISTIEARFLMRQGTLVKEDIMGTANFSDANGDVSEGMIVKLRTVKIGNKVLKNVEASIVDNEVAPLLLGQSALSRFGKFTVDYERGVIVFE